MFIINLKKIEVIFIIVDGTPWNSVAEKPKPTKVQCVEKKTLRFNRESSICLRQWSPPVGVFIYMSLTVR